MTRRVFISSTSLDLRAYRERVRDTLLSLGLFPVGMEHFGAQGTGDANSVSVEQLASSDVYLGVYAWRYGTVPAEQHRSVTHQEYEEAVRLGMPRYLFLADPSTDTPSGPEAPFPASVRDPEHRSQLNDFLAEVSRRHVVDFFKTPDDLAARVATALSNYLLQIQREELERTVHTPHDLPPRTPGFVGRDRELASLVSTLGRGQNGAAVALVGMAGSGKSALAAEAVYALANAAEAFPGGTAWIRCEGRTGLEGLVAIEDQILSAWGVALTPEELAVATSPERELQVRERALQRRLASSAGTRPALLVLDNVEHDLPLALALETFSALGMSVLLTARHEPSSPRVRIVTVDVLDPAAAAELFQERYIARGGEWDSGRDRSAASVVVEALGWLPLAIELAAARAARTHQAVSMLADELQEADRLGKLRDPLEPTHSVRFAFSRSLELLTPAQRARFALLGLPAGPDWPRPVIEQVFTATSAQAPDPVLAADDLEAMAALSLLVLTNATGDQGGPRVRLHPLLRELAREEWQRQPETDRKVEIAALLDAAGDLIEGHERDFPLLAREGDLIAGALRSAASAGVELLRVSRWIMALEPYLDLGGHWRLGYELYTLAGELSSRAGDRSGEAQAQNNLGVLAQHLGDFEAAEQAYARSLALRRELGDRLAEAESLSNLGGLAHARGRVQEAEATYQQALAIRQQLGNQQGEATILSNLGLLASERGQLGEAQDLLNRSLALGGPTAAVLSNLGGVAEAQGHAAEAHALFERALRLARETGDRSAEATALDNLGNVARALGGLSEAAVSLEQALAIRRGQGDERGEATTLHNLGVLADTMGEKRQAQEYFREALDAARASHDAAGSAAALIGLASLAQRGHELEAAEGFYAQALELCSGAGDRQGEALILAQLGAIAQAERQLDKAATAYERALAIRRDLGDNRSAGLLQNSLGLLDYARGRPAEAVTRLREALALLEGTGDEAADSVRENLALLSAEQDPAAGSAPVLPAAPQSPGQQPASSAAVRAEEGATPRRRRWPWSR
jgi:tetratricopeptide (TPR) repeat protein